MIKNILFGMSLVLVIGFFTLSFAGEKNTEILKLDQITNEGAILTVSSIQTSNAQQPEKDKYIIHFSIGMDTAPTLMGLISQSFGLGAIIEIGYYKFSLIGELGYQYISVSNSDNIYRIDNIIYGGELRFYPLNNDMRGFWLGPNLTFLYTHKINNSNSRVFNYSSGKWDNYTYHIETESKLLLYGFSVGYKFVFGKTCGYFFDPYAGIEFSPQTEGLGSWFPIIGFKAGFVW